MPSSAFQPTPGSRCAARTLASLSQSITMASNLFVNRDILSDQGTLTVTTPCSGHLTRGTSHTGCVRQSMVSR
ncbi:MAG: hypothetical protein OXC82_02330 [Rhodobacteraceae bacterium]|nr:hypothetical protein [Paracoccaceae bacterium]